MEKINIEDIWQCPEAGQAFAELKPSGNDFIDKFSEAIRAKYLASAGEYAKILGMTLSDINGLMRYYADMDAIDWIRRLRILDAKGALTYSFLTVRKIALEMMHFSSQQAFNAFFVRMEGVTPKEYRDAHRSVTVKKEVTINTR
jgi:transcriptional regulator GlxA family with amidase domain